ncbi:hypothetical protein HD597_000597 [Nonomuraea thailandensis]|uniref:Uncharacterized protein n=1 Tax=Nonomuraea thailandensis TaxID=1188745 RepID=A0A9X2G9K5_9ACTN|nr:hypothetical protein [Nonomuraea thailandensis]MCP2353577.1 hypothetical protein [Nonomuraea thailandensis]
MSSWLAALNAVVAVVTVAFAVTGVVAPTALARSDVVTSTRYYAAMYATRAVPVGVAVVVAAFLSIPNGTWIALLAVAGACQIGDAVIGLWRRIPGQVAGSVLVGAIHLASMAHLLTTR